MFKFIKRNKVNSLIKKSLKLFDNGEFNSALTLVNKILKLYPNCEKALYLKGKIYQILGKLNESLILYDKIININPKYVNAWIEKADCFVTLKNYDKSLITLDDGLNFNNNNYNLIRSKIQVFRGIGRYEEGLNYANFILKSVDKELGVELKAEIYLSEAKFTDAYNCFRKLCNINSKNIEGWYGLSSASYYLGNLDDAIKYIEKCIDLDQKNPTLLLLYSSYLIENRSYNKALKILNKSIKSYNDFNFYYLKAQCLEFLNNEKKAVKNYKKALDIGLKYVKLYPEKNYHEVISIILEKLDYPYETKKYFEKYNEIKFNK